MRESQFLQVIEWQEKTFPQANVFSKIAHLAEELAELLDSTSKKDPDTDLEFADCFLLLFGAASMYGMSYRDICNAIDEKMVINRRRTWGAPDADGVVRHIKEGNG